MRIKEIDGLRAGAVLVVMAHHYGILPGGYMGVDLFFVISGFVITCGLQRELDARGCLALRSFYTRRFFRIVPPLAFMVGVVLLIGGWRNSVDAAVALLSVMNWYRAFTAESGGFFGHAWSLSIEEQFYLLWPLALVFLNRRGWTKKSLIAAIVSIMIWRATLSLNESPERIYHGLDTHSDGLLIGCLIALLPRPAVRWWPVPVAILLTMGIMTDWESPWMLFAGYSLVALCSGALVLATLKPDHMVSRVLNCESAQWTGLRSFGIYLWHYPIYGLLYDVIEGKGLLLVVAAFLTFVMAEISFRFIERPCGRLGHVYGRSFIERPA